MARSTHSSLQFLTVCLLAAVAAGVIAVGEAVQSELVFQASQTL